MNRIDVLDRGFVELVDVMGDDEAVVQAARVSYGAGTVRKRDTEGLIRYLMRNRHDSPFEMCELKFHIKLPLFVMRQLVRHRTAHVNEYSMRYSEPEWDFYVPDVTDVSGPDPVNRQKRGAYVGNRRARMFADTVRQVNETAMGVYASLSATGAARELCRIVLPLTIYTRIYWKIDLRNLLHVIELRMAEDAQLETRRYAEALAEFVMRRFPLTWRAFEDYRLRSAVLSRRELAYLAARLQGREPDGEGLGRSEIAYLERLVEEVKDAG